MSGWEPKGPLFSLVYSGKVGKESKIIGIGADSVTVSIFESSFHKFDISDVPGLKKKSVEGQSKLKQSEDNASQGEQDPEAHLVLGHRVNCSLNNGDVFVDGETHKLKAVDLSSNKSTNPEMVKIM